MARCGSSLHPVLEFEIHGWPISCICDKSILVDYGSTRWEPRLSACWLLHWPMNMTYHVYIHLFNITQYDDLLLFQVISHIIYTYTVILHQSSVNIMPFLKSGGWIHPVLDDSVYRSKLAPGAGHSAWMWHHESHTPTLRSSFWWAECVCMWLMQIKWQWQMI